MAFNSNNNLNTFKPMADINVTPLVDVMLVLLIVFMITAPMLAAGIKLNLPQARVSQPLDQKKPIILSITRDGQILLGTENISLDDMIARLDIMIDKQSAQIIQIRGDKEASYASIISVLDKLVSNGYTHVGIITDKIKDDHKTVQ
jgi:biopolymer transport protein TolR